MLKELGFKHQLIKKIWIEVEGDNAPRQSALDLSYAEQEFQQFLGGYSKSDIIGDQYYYIGR